MSLARALALLPSDTESQRDMVSVMQVLVRRAGDEIALEDVSRYAGLPAERTRVIVQALAAGLVVDFDGVSVCRYEHDVAVELELRGLSDRLRAHQEHLQENVTRFRMHRDLL